MPTNRRIANESYSDSSAAGSERLNQCSKKVNTQHPLDSDRLASRTFRFRIKAFDGFGQLRPWNDLY